jgi:hypothetical protein
MACIKTCSLHMHVLFFFCLEKEPGWHKKPFSISDMGTAASLCSNTWNSLSFFWIMTLLKTIMEPSHVLCCPYLLRTSPAGSEMLQNTLSLPPCLESVAFLCSNIWSILDTLCIMTLFKSTINGACPLECQKNTRFSVDYDNLQNDTQPLTMFSAGSVFWEKV